MPPRANWKGHLKLSLVSCAVALYPATTTSSRIRFNIINKETGNRVKNEIVDSETGDPVPDEDRVKGYKVEGNQYILFDDEELDKVALESTHTIDIESFVPLKEVDRIYLDESFYLVPDDKVGQEAFAVIREAMREEGMVGLAKVVLYRRERLLMLQARGKGIVGTALRYNNEVREENAYFDEIPSIKVSKDMLELAVHIIKSKEGKFDPAQFEDRYENALADLIKAKRAGKRLPVAAPARPSNVINLMDALRKSVKGEGKQAHAGRAAKGRTAPRKRLKRAS
jgi:DNA end-binding protein Ku